MHTASSTIRRYRRLWFVGPLLAVALMVAAAPSARAQDAEPQITTPEPQTAVRIDEPFTVAGGGCPPGSTVRVEAREVQATTTADEDGAFSMTLTLPSSAFDLDAEPFDLNEFVINGTCDDTTFRSGVIVPEVGESQVEQVPAGGVKTGVGGTAGTPHSTIVVAVAALLATGTALATATRRRRTPSG